MKDRPYTTLFLISSLDGKISTGANDQRDFDRDLATIKTVGTGYAQYKAIERTTDLVSLNTGRVMAKIGVNTRRDHPKKIPCTFVIIDRKPHLTKRGLAYLSAWTQNVILVTTSATLQKMASGFKNITVLHYRKNIDLQGLFRRLVTDFGIQKMTIQSGGTFNAVLVRQGLIDRVSLVVAPMLIGGKDTPSLMDGKSLISVRDLSLIRPLRLVKIQPLKNSYIHLVYHVDNK